MVILAVGGTMQTGGDEDTPEDLKVLVSLERRLREKSCTYHAPKAPMLNSQVEKVAGKIVYISCPESTYAEFAGSELLWDVSYVNSLLHLSRLDHDTFPGYCADNSYQN
ncbi:hypothetical protein JTB14_018866 [Gonioctena quinquepunctata]|nr:hypothetical protein JTB14_018866 [Gonioctena quinquepunctata]